MATKRVFTVSGGGVEIYIQYNDVNERVENIYFTVPDTFSGAHVLIYDSGVLAFEDTYIPGSYSEKIPGNYKVTTYIDDDDGLEYAHLPPEIAWSLSVIP